MFKPSAVAGMQAPRQSDHLAKRLGQINRDTSSHRHNLKSVFRASEK
jgi:hypothetical protein